MLEAIVLEYNTGLLLVIWLVECNNAGLWLAMFSFEFKCRPVIGHVSVEFNNAHLWLAMFSVEFNNARLWLVMFSVEFKKQACDWPCFQLSSQCTPVIGHVFSCVQQFTPVICTIQSCDWSPLLSLQGRSRLVLLLVICTIQGCEWSLRIDELFVFTLYPGHRLSPKLFYEKKKNWR